jgi:NitT/TauT family transport system substrate-binding protein
MGFFAKEGLDADLVSIQSGSAVASAVAGNAVDTGFASLIPLAIAHTKKIPFVLIAPGAFWTQAARNDALFVAGNSPIRNAKDLNGKTLSCAGLGTLTEYAARAWIDQNGGDATTVKFVEMGYATMPAALAAGRIDAALVNEPYLGAMKKEDGRLLGYAFDAIAKEYMIGGWFSNADWAKDHPDLVKRFAAAMRDAALWANDPRNREQSTAILESYTKIDPSLAATMVHVHFGTTLAPAAVQPQVDIAAKYGGFASFPAQEIIYASSR